MFIFVEEIKSIVQKIKVTYRAWQIKPYCDLGQGYFIELSKLNLSVL